MARRRKYNINLAEQTNKRTIKFGNHFPFSILDVFTAVFIMSLFAILRLADGN